MQGYVQELTTTFGMGTNGYLMVIIFAYIGGLIAEQTRRELTFGSGSGSSVGVNFVQPLLGARPYVDEEEEAYEDDEEIVRSRRPVRAHARGHARPIVVPEAHRRRHRGPSDRLDDYRSVPAEVLDAQGRHATRLRRHPDDDEEDEDDDREVVEVRLHRAGRDHNDDRRGHHHGARSRSDDDEDEEPPERESRPARLRSQAEERAIQR